MDSIGGYPSRKLAKAAQVKAGNRKENHPIMKMSSQRVETKSKIFLMIPDEGIVYVGIVSKVKS